MRHWPVDELPKSWRLMPLAELTEPTRKRVKPFEHPDLPYIGMEHVEPHSMRLLGSVHASTMKSTAVHFKAGDVLYGRLRPYLNKVLLAEFDGLASPEFIAMPPGPQIRGRFLQYFLNHSEFVRFATALNTGDRPRVDFEQLKHFLMPVPPLGTQDLLLEHIETQSSRLWTAKAAVDAIHRKLNLYLASAINTTLSASRSEPGTMKSLESLGRSNRKIAYGVLQPGPHMADGVPLVRVQDVIGPTVEVNDQMKRVSAEVAMRYPRTELEGNELLLTVVGTIGRSAVAGASLRGANVARAVSVIPLSDDVNPHYVRYCLTDPSVVALLNRTAHEVARKTLNLEDVRRVEVWLPSRTVQDRVVSSLDEVTTKADSLRSSLRNVSRMSRVFLDSLLTSAFAGRPISAI